MKHFTRFFLNKRNPGGLEGLFEGWRFAVGGFLATLLFGCASAPPEPPSAPVSMQSGVLYEWIPDGLSGEPSITIDLRTQRAEVYIGGQYAGWSAVATGKEGFSHTCRRIHDP